MKTLNELKEEGLMSVGLYNSIFRGIWYDKYFSGLKPVEISKEIGELTVKDIFDLFGEERILKWRYIGPKKMKELKSLA